MDRYLNWLSRVTKHGELLRGVNLTIIIAREKCDEKSPSLSENKMTKNSGGF